MKNCPLYRLLVTLSRLLEHRQAVCAFWVCPTLTVQLSFICVRKNEEGSAIDDFNK